MRRRGARQLVRGLTAAAVAVSLAVTVTTQPRADSVDDRKKAVDAQIADLQESLEGANADFVTAAVALKRSQLQLTDARAALGVAQQRLAAAVAQDRKLAADLAFAQAEQAKAERELAAQTHAEARTRQALGRIARQAYAGSGFSGLSVVLDASSPDQLTDQMVVAAVAARTQSETIDRLVVQQAQLRARSGKLDAVRAHVAELKRQSALVVAQRQTAQDAAEAAEATVSALVVQEQQAVAAIQSRIAGEKARLDELSREQERLQAVLRERARAAEEARRKAGRSGSGGSNGSGPGGDSGGGSSGGSGGAAGPGRGSGYLSYPARGPITSGFGMRFHPILRISRLHSGIDYGIPCGTPVYAAAGGEVIQSGRAGGYGNRIVIDHGLLRGVDLATTYNHLSRIVVGGGRVNRGQLIAYSGTTGLSTGCHLHFETLANGAYVNPRNWL